MKKTILISYTLMGLISLIYFSKTNGLHATPNPSSHTEKVKETGRYPSNEIDLKKTVSSIIDKKIFTLSSKPTLTPKVIKSTTLNISLVGIIQNSSGDGATALISQHGKQKEYHVEDTIDKSNNNVFIHQIEPHRIIIKNNSEFETLELFSPDKSNERQNSKAKKGPSNKTPSNMRDIFRLQKFRP